MNTSVAEWQNRALAAAGIDPRKWDPSDGFNDNKQNIQKVYALYAQWYLQHPELKWAGMAKLAGGTVYGGLLKLREERPSFGVRDILTKSFGSTNPVNLVRATFDGLAQLRTRKQAEKQRGVKIA